MVGTGANIERILWKLRVLVIYLYKPRKKYHKRWALAAPAGVIQSVNIVRQPVQPSKCDTACATPQPEVKSASLDREPVWLYFIRYQVEGFTSLGVSHVMFWIGACASASFQSIGEEADRRQLQGVSQIKEGWEMQESRANWGAFSDALRLKETNEHFFLCFLERGEGKI